MELSQYQMLQHMFSRLQSKNCKLSKAAKLPLFTVIWLLVSGWLMPASAQSDNGPTITRTPTHVLATYTVTQSSVYTLTTEGTSAPVNHRVTITNDGNSSAHLILTRADENWSSLQSILMSILSEGMTPAERAMAIYMFGLRMRYHWWPSTIDYDLHDPVKLFNLYGYGFCDDISAALAALFEAADLPSRIWHLGAAGEHTVVEAYYDGRWHMFDADRDGLYLLRDNQTIAGVTDLIADPELVARAGPNHEDLVNIYANTDVTSYYPGYFGYITGHEVSLHIAPQESFTYYWQPISGYHDDTGWGEPGPPLYANGQFVRLIDPTQPTSKLQFLSLSNTRFGVDDNLSPALSPITATSNAEVEIEINTPYPLVEAALDLQYVQLDPNDQITVLLSRTSSVVDFLPYDLLNERYKIPDFFLAQSNLSSFSQDGLWPALHSTIRFLPAHLDFQVRRRAGIPMLTIGQFYRQSIRDTIALFVSQDGAEWQRVWEAGPQEIGYFTAQIDLSSVILENQVSYLRYEFIPYEYPTSTGVNRLQINGLAPYNYQTIWTSAEPTSEDGKQALLDLSNWAAPREREATYNYVVKFVMTAFLNPLSIGIQKATLTNTVQVSPFALPDVRLGENQFGINVTNSPDNIKINIIHMWEEVTNFTPPLPPTTPIFPPDGSNVDISQPMTLAWESSVDPDGDTIQAYYLEICAYSDCRWPVSPVLTQYIGAGETSLIFPFTDWLRHNATYFWRVKAMDVTGRWGDFSKIWSFTVVEMPLSALSIDAPSVVAANQLVVMTATLQAGSNTLFTWQFSDGLTLHGATVERVFLTAGLYTVIITAVDNEHIYNATFSINVLPSIEQPQKLWLPFVRRD